MNKKLVMLLCIFVVSSASTRAQEEAPKPRKVEVDSNYDGITDRVEYYNDKGEVSRVESDTDFDGINDQWVYYKNGEIEKAEKDTNGDGKPDQWIEY